MGHAGCVFCCRHSYVQDMNVRIFGVRAMECVFVQIRPRFIFSSERVFGKWSQNPCPFQGENPLYRMRRGGSNPQRCNTQGSEPNTLPAELFRPRKGPIREGEMGVVSSCPLSSHTSEMNIGAVGTTQPCTWLFQASTSTGWPVVCVDYSLTG